MKTRISKRYAITCAWVLLAISQAGCESQYRPASWKNVSDEVTAINEEKAGLANGTETPNSKELNRFGELTTWGQAADSPSMNSARRQSNLSGRNSTLPERSSSLAGNLTTLTSRERPSNMSTLPNINRRDDRITNGGNLPGNRQTTLPNRAPFNRSPDEAGTTLPRR